MLKAQSRVFVIKQTFYIMNQVLIKSKQDVTCPYFKAAAPGCRIYIHLNLTFLTIKKELRSHHIQYI